MQQRAGTYTFGEPETFTLLGEMVNSYPHILPPYSTPEYEYESEFENEDGYENELRNDSNSTPDSEGLDENEIDEFKN